MKKTIFSLIACAAFFAGQAQNQDTQMDSLSYSVGVLVAQNLKSQGLSKLDPASLAKAIEDVVNGNELAITPDQAQQVYLRHMESQKLSLKEENLAWLEKNKERPEVKTTPSGLQYEVIEMGDGPKPGPTDKVTVHYTGMLIDGTVFDSSVQRGEPITFPVNGVIAGWQEALQMMPVGSKWKLYIPYNLAYGERGAGSQIGPFATLIFEVELLGIEK